MRRTTIILCLALVGCAGAWSRPGSTQADLTRDQMVCDYEGERSWVDNPDAFASGWNQGQISTACMKLKGWTR
jgi:hypothetical protein